MKYEAGDPAGEWAEIVANSRYTHPATALKHAEPLAPLVDRDFEDAVDSILAELRATMLKKQADYGPKNISQSPGGPLNGLRVRMFDKLARISNLYESGVQPENESIQDSFLDIGNYGIIGLMVLRGQWPGTEQ